VNVNNAPEEASLKHIILWNQYPIVVAHKDKWDIFILTTVKEKNLVRAEAGSNLDVYFMCGRAMPPKQNGELRFCNEAFLP
jgi:hypothetical protein